MGNTLIVTTGNSELVSELVGGVMRKKGLCVTVKNVTDTGVGELGGCYGLTMLGASSWGADLSELQEDFSWFFEELDSACLKGKKVAVFGCCDCDCAHCCGAVDLLEERVLSLGAHLLAEPLRIDGTPEDAVEEIRCWIETIIGKMRQAA